MIKKRTTLILIMLMIIIISIQSTTFAFELLPNLENQDLVTDQIEIILKLSDLSDFENGINVVSGKLIYDHNVFESVSFNGIDGWTSAYNDQKDTDSEGKFMLITTSGNLKQDKDVARVSLKVKPDVKDIVTSINIESIETSYEYKTIKAEDKEIKIEIKDNKISLAKENEKASLTSNQTAEVNTDNRETNYNIYVIVVVIIIVLIMLLIFIIKMGKKGGKNNEK